MATQNCKEFFVPQIIKVVEDIKKKAEAQAKETAKARIKKAEAEANKAAAEEEEIEAEEEAEETEETENEEVETEVEATEEVPEETEIVLSAEEQAMLTMQNQFAEGMANLICKYIFTECAKDKALDDAIALKHKSAERCFKFVFNKAKELNVKGSMCLWVPDEEVYGWIKSYYFADDKAEVEAEIAKEEEEAKKKAEALAKKAEKDAKKAESLKKNIEKAKKLLAKGEETLSDKQKEFLKKYKLFIKEEVSAVSPIAGEPEEPREIIHNFDTDGDFSDCAQLSFAV